MAGFSLGGNSNPNQPPTEDQIPPESLFFYHSAASGSSGNRNEEITTTYAKGFELWQQHQHQHQHHQHLHQQQQHQRHHQFTLYSSGPPGSLGIFGDDPLGGAGPSSIVIGSGSGGSGRGMRGTGGGMNCQDCGNQAKKDCIHMRCRTCCKSRNLQCPTHVKSTWVPASKRRERQQQLMAAMQQQHHQSSSRLISPSGGGGGGGGGGGSGSGEPSKRPREITTLACTHLATTTVTTSNSGMEVAGAFPSEVSSPAIFRCVKVSAMDDADEQYAYQTAVSIGGHMFKGILYDQGTDSQYSGGGGHHGETSSSSPAGIASSTAAASAPTSAAAAAVSTMMDPSSYYPTPLNSFMSGK